MMINDIVIIYNPNSTGDAPAIAKVFKRAVVKALPNATVKLLKTEHAGHAEELAYTSASKSPNILLVSSSGDGGYHEVINGAMRAIKDNKAQPICAVLPGGNANDHHTAVARRPLLDAILAEGIEPIDLISVEANDTLRYAHAYVGLGLTPLVAIELNRHSLNALREAWLAIKTFWKYRPFSIEIDGRRQPFNSLVAANIDRMAKHLTLSNQNSLVDGQFELIAWPASSKLVLLVTLLKSAFGRGPKATQHKELLFKTLKPMPLQLDGEITELDSGVEVAIRAVKAELRIVR